MQMHGIVTMSSSNEKKKRISLKKKLFLKFFGSKTEVG